MLSRFKKIRRFCKQKSKSGFSLIEILIAIFFVSVGLIGLVAFFNANIKSGAEDKNELIAAGLAQEVTEIARYIVDSYYLNGNTDWYGDLYTKGDSTYCTGIDRDILLDTGVVKCKKKAKVKENVVCFNPASGTYQQPDKNKNCNSNPGWIDTGFYRTVQISKYPATGDLDNGACLKVVVTVGWPNSDSACKSNILNCPYKTTSTDIICKPRQ